MRWACGYHKETGSCLRFDCRKSTPCAGFEDQKQHIDEGALADELDEVEAVERVEAVFDAAPWLKAHDGLVPGCLQTTFADLFLLTTLARRAGRDRERALISGRIDGLRLALNELLGSISMADAEERIEQRIRDLHATPV